MGSGVGVHTDDQVNDLTPEERRILKQFIISQLQTSSEIRELINDDRLRDKSVLPTFLAMNENIRNKLVDASEELFQRLKKK
jgi:hypothetical protein